MMNALCTHPNVGGVLLVSLGCESFDRNRLAEEIAETGRPVHKLVIQQEGGTRKTIDEGLKWVGETIQEIKQVNERGGYTPCRY